MSEVHVTYVFDEEYAKGSLVSLFSLLRHRTGPTRATLFAAERSAFAEAAVRALSQRFPSASLELRYSEAIMSLTDAEPGGPSYITAPTFGRLLLPNELNEKVLYLDGDTLIRRDVGPLWATPLDDNLVAAAIDNEVLRSVLSAERRLLWSRRRRHRRRIDKLMAVGDLDVRNYFNSGVMVMDLPAITLAGYAEVMSDWRKAVNTPTIDQDYLNVVFKNRAQLIDHEWNSFWGNPRTALSPFNRKERQDYARSRSDPAILHFVGPHKPWFDEPKQIAGRQRWIDEWRQVASEAPFPI